MEQLDINLLIRKHDHDIRYMALLYRKSGLSFQELVHEGRIALWRAAQKWRPDGGAALWTYARKSVSGAMLRLVTKQVKTQRDLQREDALFDVYIEDPKAELCTLIDEAISLLDEKKQDVILRWTLGMTFKEIAADVGRSDRAVRRTFQDAIKTMRKRA